MARKKLPTPADSIPRFCFTDNDLDPVISHLATFLSDNLTVAKDQISADAKNEGHWTNASKLAELCANVARDRMYNLWYSVFGRLTNTDFRTNSRTSWKNWSHPNNSYNYETSQCRRKRICGSGSTIFCQFML
jgi:hypothetical protein